MPKPASSPNRNSKTPVKQSMADIETISILPFSTVIYDGLSVRIYKLSVCLSNAASEPLIAQSERRASTITAILNGERALFLAQGFANTSVDAHNFGYASALTTVAFVILLFCSIVYLRLSKFGGEGK